MDFQQSVLNLVKKIPKGKVTTYKEIANALNNRAYRAVGMALNKNKNPVKIPCHRVVCSNESIGGYSRGVIKKIALLKKEGVKVKNNRIDLKKYFFRLKSK